MDARAFDRVARGLAGTPSRRGLLQLLTALPVAVVSQQIAGEETLAARRHRVNHRPGKRKDRRQRRRQHGDDGRPGLGAGVDCAGTLKRAGCAIDSFDNRWGCPRGAKLQGAALYGCNLRNARLAGVLLNGAILNNIDLSDADLYRANLHDASLVQATLVGASLDGVDLGGGDLREANLSEVRFRDGSLNSADLSRTNLKDAKLQNTDLRGATWHIPRCPDNHVTPAILPGNCCGHLNGYTTPNC